MADKILIYLEQRNGQIKKSSIEAVAVGKEYAEKLGGETVAVVIGDDVNKLTEIGGYGVSKIIHAKNPDLADYSPSAYTKILSEIAEETGATILVFANTSLGKDLAPRVSVKINAGIAIDCVDFHYDNGEILATRPIYAGKVLADIKIKSQKKIFTIRPNVFKAGESSGSAAEIIVKEITNPDLSTKVIEIKKAEGKIDVAEADVIVSGGRGLKGPENFHLIEELANELNAATGASRAVVDAGWRPHGEQVGQTGKTVSPNLYIAVGISGAIQHLAGMRSSKYIVAINKDKDAPIFQVADYGIAGDALEVLPVLIQEIKKLKAN
ncbi:MAG: electron transfer flavoprotein subunit alpha/FixB family protein [bacterium]